MKKKTAKDLQFGYAKIVLFSSEAAKKGLEDHLDIFMRREEFSRNAWVGITKGSTKEVLAAKPEVPESVSDLLINVFSQTGTDTMEILPIYMYQFYSDINEPGETPYAMVVSPQTRGNKIQLSQLALFRNGKLAGYASASQTMLLQMLKNKKMVSAAFTIDKYTLIVLKSHSEIKWTPETLHIRVKLRLSLDQTPRHQLVNSAEKEDLVQNIDSKIETDMQQLIYKMQQLKVDPAAFGENYRITHGGQLNKERWLDSIFPQMKVKVDVSSELIREGMIK
jgi:Ger(x)C family germination protein